MKQVFFAVALVFSLGCGRRPEAVAGGTLHIAANGEDLVREGFTSRDGWDMAFHQVLVTIAEVTPAISDPPFEPHGDDVFPCQGRETLHGPFTVDLVFEGESVPVTTLSGAPPGHYNAVSWKLVPGESGYSILLTGTASRPGEELPFTIGFENSWLLEAGEYIGDERKGMLEAGGTAGLELTFHFDHIFGDSELAPHDPLNLNAPGFDVFVPFIQGETVADLALLRANLPADEFAGLLHALAGLFHVGEGHVRCTEL